jgi:hypothetical protein
MKRPTASPERERERGEGERGGDCPLKQKRGVQGGFGIKSLPGTAGMQKPALTSLKGG